MEARALVREARSQLFSHGERWRLRTRARRARPSRVFRAIAGAERKQSQVFSLPGEVSWEPDLWGKVRNTVHASQYTAQVTAADLENERLTEQASLAEYFFEIRGQDALANDSERDCGRGQEGPGGRAGAL